MLFRTVYGPELGIIYSFVLKNNRRNIYPSRQEIYNAFLLTAKDKICSTQNIDDAISFLKSAKLFRESDGLYYSDTQEDIPFSIQLLQALRRLEIGERNPLHPLDCLYMTILNELFIKPDQSILNDLHISVNQLTSIQNAGGLGKEKLQGWMRVMEYLGVGKRIQGNFLCLYSPTLILEIIHQWPHPQGTLQSFFEDSFVNYLPFSNSSGDLSQIIQTPMLELVKNKNIDLYPLQDSPTRPYFGQNQFRGIKKRD